MGLRINIFFKLIFALVATCVTLSTFVQAASICEILLETARQHGVVRAKSKLFEAFLSHLERKNVVKTPTSVKVLEGPVAIRRKSEPWNALRYRVEILLANGATHKVDIITTTKNSSPHDLLQVMTKVPSEFLLSADSYIFHDERNPHDALWKALYKDFTTTQATGGIDPATGKRTIDIYPIDVPKRDRTGVYRREVLLEILHHELGHTFAAAKFGSTEPPIHWREAIELDGNDVSEYGKTNAMEDFAECIRLYIETDAGITSPETRAKYPNRFALMDLYIGLHVSDTTTSANYQTMIDALESRPQLRGIFEKLHDQLAVLAFGSADKGLLLDEDSSAEEPELSGSIIYNKVAHRIVVVMTHNSDKSL